MTKHFCDICEEEITFRSYDIKMNAHIRNTDPLQGHSAMVKGVLHPVSSVERLTMCCLPCYNKVMYPLWENIKKLKTKV